MKNKYKVRTWPGYNKALKQRGDLNIWLNEDSASRWHSEQKTGKKGRPELYSDDAILAFLTLRSVFYLPLRAAEGFMGSLIAVMKLDLQIPSYTQVSRRSKDLGATLAVLSKKRVTDLVIDSTGLKVYPLGFKIRFGAPENYS